MARGIIYSGCLLSRRLTIYLLDLILVNLIEKQNEVVTVNVSSEGRLFQWIKYTSNLQELQLVFSIRIIIANNLDRHGYKP